MDRQRIVELIRQRLINLHESGVQTLPRPSGQSPAAKLLSALEPPPTAEVKSHQTAALAEPAAVGSSTPPPVAESQSSATGQIARDEPYGAPLPIDQRREQLAVLAESVSHCTRCSELSACRTQTVFGVGTTKPRLCFLGEGPGADEDRQGEPFVGAAGQLLNRILAACQLRREEVYILNTVKCRPPGNRNPSDAEIANCWSYAEQQLEILQPEFICCLGSVAARTLLGTRQSIGRLRQRFHTYRGSQVIVTYHPAYLLRNPDAKRPVWDDMKMLMAAMGVEL